MSLELPFPTFLRLIDGFALRAGGASVHVALPGQRLLAFLAIQRRSATRKAIAAALWGDRDDQQAAARLRSTLWRLPITDGRRLVETDGTRLRLAGRVDIDVDLSDDDDRVGDFDVAHLTGEILPDWTEDWVDIERERFRQLRFRRLEQLSAAAQRLGRFELALQAALAAVALEPLRESAHRRVMLVHLGEHNPVRGAPAVRDRARVAAGRTRPEPVAEHAGHRLGSARPTARRGRLMAGTLPRPSRTR